MTERHTLWAATVRTKTLAERIEAAKAGGFSSMSAFPIDIKNWGDAGMTPTQIGQQARDGGVPITILDPFTQWVPRWKLPDGMSEADGAFTDFDQTTFLDMAAGLGVRKMSVIESFGADYTMDELVRAFTRISDVGNEAGLQVQLEFMPFSRVSDLETAWEIIRRANRGNAGMVFDTWHYYRGKVNHDLLRQIPGHKIFSLQLADAQREIRGGSLFNDLMHYRMAPGEGDFDLPTVVSILDSTGGLGDIGVELFSDIFDTLSPTEAGQRARDGVADVLAKGLSRTA
jgi:sugar phosphate isomerase/epimerase